MANMQMTKTPMPEQDPQVRNANFLEVAQGYTLEQAMNEAQRCIHCKNPACVSGCPVGIPIPDFLAKVAEGDIAAAYEILSNANALPAISGRVCPQENQCEGKCVRGVKGEPVAIGRVERFVADWAAQQGIANVATAPKNGHKTAVIGSGPAGLTCAGELARMGYDVTVFEAFHTAGGVLTYGIPEFRLPKAIVAREVSNLEKMGVDIELNMVIGKVLTIPELFERGYEAVFVASGAGLPMFMKIPGEGLVGVYSANEYLTRINLMKAYKDTSKTPIQHAKNVAVVGGGNTAMDAARAALRAGAKSSTLVYRRTKKYMPADAEELEMAIADGVEFLELVAPVEQKDGKLICEKMKLGDPDDKGRRKPVPTGEMVEIPCDTVVSAVGEKVESEVFTRNGITVDEKGIPAFKTNLEGVYAGGDAMRGPATVVEGIADAQYFANAVIGEAHKFAIPAKAVATREEAVAKKGVLCESAKCEGDRCLTCNVVCQVCADVCPNRANVVIELPDGRQQILHVDRMCNECGNCAVFCPYDSAPYREKFTLFLTREGFDESVNNQGFLPLGGKKVLVRLDSKVFEADLDAKNDLPADIEVFIWTVLTKYAYLMG